MGRSTRKGQILIELLLVVGFILFCTIAVVRLCETTRLKAKSHRFEMQKREKSWQKSLKY